MNSKVREQLEVARGRLRIRAVRGGKWWRERGKKGLSALPHLFTLLNLAFGIIAIILTTKAEYQYAALMIVGSLAADGLDGRIARWLNADGEFGKELDSLADVVSFGTAPAILLYEIGLYQLGYYGLAIALVFPMCGALRLARFNIIKTSGFFLGVPITAAGTLLSCLTYYILLESTPEANATFIALAMLVLSYLMISAVPYPDFKKRRRRASGLRIAPLIGPILIMVAIAYRSNWNPWSLLVIPLTVYVAVGPWLLLVRYWSERILPWLAGPRRE